VKLSTPRAPADLQSRPGDVGRQLSDITSTLIYDGFYDDVHAVLRHLQTIEREVTTRDDRWHSVKIHPYRTSDDRIEGACHRV
jgi:two-component system CheB/CheR fusion protein